MKTSTHSNHSVCAGQTACRPFARGQKTPSFRCYAAIALLVLVSLFRQPTTADAAKPKPVNLLALKSAGIATSKSGKTSASTLKRLTDGDTSTSITVSAKNAQAFEVVYSFAGKTVTPRELEVQIAARRSDGKPVAMVKIMASSLSEKSGFQSLREDVLKASSKPQRFQFKPVGAKWILVRITPMPNSGGVAVAELVVRGHAGPPETTYRFNESPAKAFAVLAQLRKTVKVAVSADEAKLFKDASDGKLDSFSFADATLIASGITEGKKRREYLRRIAKLEAQIRGALADAKTPLQRGDRLLRWLHAGPLKAGYRSKQTLVSTVLDEKTYNCVSSAVVYNILGRRLGLDLRGIEVPDHAFSILYVGKRHYDVETTSKGGFAPARNPAVLKELREKSGVHYMPERNRDKRREIDDLGLAALIYYNRGVTLMKQKKHDAALVAFFCALSLDAEFASAVKNVLAVLTNWSRGLAKAGKYENALSVVGVGLKLAPKDATLNHNYKVYWTNWALAAIDAANHDRALKILARADAAIKGGEFAEMRSYVFTRSGEKLASKRKWSDALALANSGIKKTDGKANQELRRWRTSLYVRWANGEAMAGRYEEAVRIVGTGLKAAPRNVKLIHNHKVYWTRWARAAVKSGDQDCALKILKKADTAIEGDEFAKMRSLVFILPGEKLVAKRKWSEALALAATGLKKIDGKAKLELETWRNGLYLAWGNAEMKRRRYDAATDALAKGHAAAPKNKKINNNLAYVAQEWTGSVHRKDGLDKALQVAIKLQKRFPKIAGVQDSTARFVGRAVSGLYRKGKYAEALKAIDQAASVLKNPKQAGEMREDIYDDWARSFWKKNKQYDKGLGIYRTGLKKLPGNPRLTQNAVYVWNLKGMPHIKAKNWNPAIAIYNAALKEFPKSGTLKRNLRYCEQQKQRTTRTKT